MEQNKAQLRTAFELTVSLLPALVLVLYSSLHSLLLSFFFFSSLGMQAHVVELAKSKYAKHIVARMLEHGTKAQRSQIIAQFMGKVRKLIKHKLASIVLAQAWADYATPAERMQLMQEMYGPEFAIFKVRRTRRNGQCR